MALCSSAELVVYPEVAAVGDVLAAAVAAGGGASGDDEYISCESIGAEVNGACVLEAVEVEQLSVHDACIAAAEGANGDVFACGHGGGFAADGSQAQGAGGGVDVGVIASAKVADGNGFGVAYAVCIGVGKVSEVPAVGAVVGEGGVFCTAGNVAGDGAVVGDTQGAACRR
ncbi:hypothetical protein CUZ56_01965 [Saezia sanguinis]|uniref:Uncharacterized protein n=1 Tax=Saezia sanguinis TaxID=1965230 RepID=A0A433SDI5_9BURK|nr:hypothetical protein CUZ56_01965 [Saezia sanguinis]